MTSTENAPARYQPGGGAEKGISMRECSPRGSGDATGRAMRVLAAALMALGLLGAVAGAARGVANLAALLAIGAGAAFYFITIDSERTR